MKIYGKNVVCKFFFTKMPIYYNSTFYDNFIILIKADQIIEMLILIQ